MDPIVRRILEALRSPELLDGLAALPGSDLQSLLLAVMRARAARITPAALVTQIARNPLLAAAEVGARALHELDGVAFAAAAGFDAIELAPVTPFGIDAVLGAISPNNVLAALRGTQVLADPTSALTLEAARRRRGAPRAQATRLCTSQRLVRLQPFDQPGLTPHFRLFAMVTCDRDRGGFDAEIVALREQLAVYLRLLRGLTVVGYRFDPVEIAVSDTDVVRGLIRAQGADPDEVTRAVHATDADGGAGALASRGLVLPRAIADPIAELGALDADPAGRAGRRRLARVVADVIPPLAAEFPEARVRIDGSRIAGLGYYAGLCLLLWATVPGGPTLPVADGGFTTWTQRLLGDRKERLLISGIGSELLAKLFRDEASSRDA